MTPKGNRLQCKVIGGPGRELELGRENEGTRKKTAKCGLGHAESNPNFSRARVRERETLSERAPYLTKSWAKTGGLRMVSVQYYLTLLPPA